MKHLVTLIAIALGLSLWGVPPHDPDLGWHLFGGAIISTSGHLPYGDPLNTFNSYWFDYHWGAQLLFFKIYSLGGYDALCVALGLLMAVYCVVILDIIRILTRHRASALSEVLYLLFFWEMSVLVTSIRPQMIALLLLALALRQLLSRPRPFELPFLFFLTVLAVNIHVYWIFIPFLWGCFRILPRVRNRSRASASYAYGGFLLLLAAGFVSPYGIGELRGASHTPWGVWGNYALLIDYLFGSNELKYAINELKGALEGPRLLPYLLLLYTVLVFRRVRSKRVVIRLPIVASGVSAFILALRALKFVGPFALIGLPLLVKSSLSVRLRIDRWANRSRRAASAAVILGALLSLAFCYSRLPTFQDNRGILSRNLPLAACGAIPSLNPAVQSAYPHLRVMTHFDYGGWCRWSAYLADPKFEIRVTTDGRTQFVPKEHFEKSFDLYRLNYGWASTLAHWNPDLVLAEKGRALGEYLGRASTNWALRHEDERFLLFAPLRRPILPQPKEE